jgi:hypothetical protein
MGFARHNLSRLLPFFCVITHPSAQMNTTLPY